MRAGSHRQAGPDLRPGRPRRTWLNLVQEDANAKPDILNLALELLKLFGIIMNLFAVLFLFYFCVYNVSYFYCKHVRFPLED